MMICSRDEDSPSVTDYNDDFDVSLFCFLACIVASLCVLTTHITDSQCVNVMLLLTYLLTYLLHS